MANRKALCLVISSRRYGSAVCSPFFLGRVITGAASRKMLSGTGAPQMVLLVSDRLHGGGLFSALPAFILGAGHREGS